MNIKNRILFLLTAIFLFAVNSISAQSDLILSENPDSLLSEQDDKLFLTFNYGAAASWLTRITKQTERSNFVLKDFLPGLYFSANLQNIKLITPEVRLTAYYPLISIFNQMPQKSNTPLHFAADLFAGVRLGTGWGSFMLNGGLGLHMFFMTSDRWNYLNLGAAGAAGFGLAISSRWTLLIDFFASVDSGNLGGNRQMEPFDLCYQYQTSIGVRYSKKKLNSSALFMPKSG